MSMSSVEAFAAAQAKYAQPLDAFGKRSQLHLPGCLHQAGGGHRAGTILPGTILRGATVIGRGAW